MISGYLADKCDLEVFNRGIGIEELEKNKAFAEFYDLIISAREPHPKKALLSFLCFGELLPFYLGFEKELLGVFPPMKIPSPNKKYPERKSFVSLDAVLSFSLQRRKENEH